MTRRLALLALTFALAACQQSSPTAATAADGEILPGSTSDAMLPLDTVRSQAPLAPKPVEVDRAQTGSARPASPAARGTSPAAVDPAAAAPSDTLAEPEPGTE